MLVDPQRIVMEWSPEMLITKDQFEESKDIVCRHHRVTQGVYLVSTWNPERLLFDIRDPYHRCPMPRDVADFNAYWEKRMAFFAELGWQPREDEYGEPIEPAFHGVCDNHEQVLAAFPNLTTHLLDFCIMMVPVKRADQPPRDGWRWHKWGPYIGTHKIEHEYLYHEVGIETVYTYKIYEVPPLSRA